MDATGIAALVDIFAKGGSLAFFVFIIVTGFREYWVFGWVHRERVEELQAENARLRAENLTYLNDLRGMVRLTNKVITYAESGDGSDAGAPPVKTKKGVR